MERKGRRRADAALLSALSCGATVEAAAPAARVSRSTAQRRRKDPAFQRQLQEVQADMLKRTASMAIAAGMGAVKTLVLLQDPSIPPPTRLGAARSVLDAGLRLQERVDFTGRLAAVEKQVKPADGNSSAPDTAQSGS
jgi:hypothetical protein